MSYTFIHRLLLICCLISIPIIGLTQTEQIIVGQIIDLKTQQPVNNAAIWFEKTLIVAHSNNEGYFFLKGNGNNTRLEISADGYKTKRIRIKPQRSLSISLELTPLPVSALPLELIKEDACSKAIIEHVIQYKPINNPEKGYRPSTESERVKAYACNIPKGWLQGSSVAKAATLSLDSLYTLPLFTEDKVYRQPDFPSVREDKELFFNKQLTVLPVSKEYMEHLVGLFLPHQNFYDNRVAISGNYFLSPIANGAQLHYSYFLIDSSLVKGHKIYNIGFRPKRKGEFLLNGTLSVDSATYALTYINVSLPRTIAINFVHSITIQQTFAYDRGNWYYHTINNFLVLDFSLIEGFRQNPLEITINKELLFNLPEANNADLSTLQKERNATGSEPTNDSLYKRLERFNDTHFMKTAAWTTDLLMYQYAHVGKIDIGPFNTIYHNNVVDGPTVALGMRTNELLWKRFSIGGNIGYAFQDNSWKFGSVALYRLPTRHFQQVDFQYSRNAYRTGFNEDIFLVNEGKVSPSDDDAFATLFRFNPNTSINEIAAWRLRYQREWTREFKTTVTLFDNRIFSNKYVPFMQQGNEVESFLQQGAKIDFRFSRDQLIWDQCFSRRNISNSYPVFHFQVEGGNFQFNQTNGNYFKAVTTLNHTINFVGGSIFYIAEAGYLLGSVPFPLLTIERGNETYEFSDYNFNLVNYLEYATDKYVNLQAHYYSSGLFLNKIPIIKKLGLLESFSLKVAEGGLRDDHNEILTFPAKLQGLNIPYVEGGAGIYNLFGFLGGEVDWRLTHRNDPNANKWGIRVFFYISI
jgi:hypothetical protein